jgi:hypothetical protein
MRYNSIFFLFVIISFIAACNSKPGNEAGDKKTVDTNTSVSPLSPSATEALALATIFQNVFNRPLGDSVELLGREVRIDSANTCIRLFGPEMDRYGLQRRGGRPVRINIRSSRQRTDTVILGGIGFVPWIKKIVDEFDPVGLGKNIDFKLTFGILNEDFLATYIGRDSPLFEIRKNRITVFIIPVPRNGEKFTHDPTVYELGGLQP